jgi:putative hemolysin
MRSGCHLDDHALVAGLAGQRRHDARPEGVAMTGNSSLSNPAFTSCEQCGRQAGTSRKSNGSSAGIVSANQP